jgi:hypothetical protein
MSLRPGNLVTRPEPGLALLFYGLGLMMVPPLPRQASPSSGLQGQAFAYIRRSFAAEKFRLEHFPLAFRQLSCPAFAPASAGHRFDASPETGAYLTQLLPYG